MCTGSKIKAVSTVFWPYINAIYINAIYILFAC